MEFFIAMNPPTVTAQEKQVRVVHGKPVFYDPPKVREAKQSLMGYLSLHAPDAPLTGPLALAAVWLFPAGSRHRHGEWRTSRPDTDNLQKMLKDCMTACGFWQDDAQVVCERIEKRWSDEPCGIWISVDRLSGKGGKE